MLACQARGLAAALLASSLTFTGDAFAMGALLATPADAAAVTEVRFAESETGARTTRWASLHVVGNATALAWVVPVVGGAYVDAASDAWLEALEVASAPRILPPVTPPPCGQTGGVDVEGDLDHVATVAPSSVVLAPDTATLAMVLAMLGISPSSQLSTALDEVATPGTTFVVLGFANPPGDMVTRTVRVVDSSPLPVSFSLLEGAPPATAITAYLFSPGGVAVASGQPLAIPASSVLWTGYGTSNYPSLAASGLYGAPGSWLVDTSGHGPLFDTTTLPDGEILAALDATYFARAASYGDIPDPTGCIQGAAQAALAMNPLAPACPAGAMAVVGAGGCEETVEPNETDPGLLRCGGIADDMAVALSGLVPGTAWLTRTRSVLLSGQLGGSAAVPPVSGAALGPVFTAAGYDETCGSPTPAGTSAQPTGGSTASSSGSSSATGTAVSTGTDVASSVANAAANDDSCSCGDDPGDEDSSNSSCGGDTSEGSDSGCSGGDAGDAASGCSGGPDNCSTAERRRQRSSMSRTLVALAFAAAVARRARRARSSLPTSA